MYATDIRGSGDAAGEEGDYYYDAPGSPRPLPLTAPSLTLLGAGHAHLFVLEALALGRFRPASVTLVSARPVHAYSGMFPGLLAGRYGEADVTFDIRRLAERAGARFVEGVAAGIDPGARRLRLEDGRTVPFEVLSVATGSMPAGLEVPGVRAHARQVRPLSRALELAAALDEAAARGAVRVIVVGGGAAGVEVACALARRLAGAGGRGSVTLVGAGPQLVAERPAAVRRLAELALRRLGVGLVTGSAVTAVHPGGVQLASGAELPADLVAWAAGAAPPAWLAASGLPCDAQGYLRVDATLRSPADPCLFAAGDAAGLEGAPWVPRAGVYAVREGPVLAHNLAVACGGTGRRRRYRPQRDFLALLNTGDGRAILSWRGLAADAAWAMRLKDRIDRAFMARFHRLERADAAATP